MSGVLSEEDISRVRSQIAATGRFIYLNTGFSGPSPRSVLEAPAAWTQSWYDMGLTTPEAWGECQRMTEEVRGKVAAFLGCAPQEVTLTDNTSHGIAIVAGGLAWREGDEVVTNELEHPSGLLPWFLLRERRRVRVKVVSFPPGADPLEELAKAITPRTRLICVSHIMYSTGMLLPVAEIARQAHQVGALCLVDGAQSAGQIPLDMAGLDCDFYAIPGQKWLLGPWGTGALYLRKELLDSVYPALVGWNTVESFGLGGSFVLRPSAQRYEGATQAHALLAGLGAALDFAEGLGWQACYHRIAELAASLRERLREVPGLTLLEPLGSGRPSALVCFNLAGQEPERVVRALYEGWRIVCRSIPHPPCVRVCTHFFNTEEELETLVGALRAIQRQFG
jgi:L-cysteine/cystine lyase